eukprot:Skav203559  [mRNA]  locus=scaffold3576:140601:146316:+ [translate_table: standard]
MGGIPLQMVDTEGDVGRTICPPKKRGDCWEGDFPGLPSPFLRSKQSAPKCLQRGDENRPQADWSVDRTA